MKIHFEYKININIKIKKRRSENPLNIYQKETKIWISFLNITYIICKEF